MYKNTSEKSVLSKIWAYGLFTSTSTGSGIKNENISNKRPLNLAHIAKVSDPMQELAEELHKPIITKFKEKYSHLLLTIFRAQI